MPRLKKPICTECGLCCICFVKNQSVYCNIGPSDVARLDRSFVKDNVIISDPLDTLLQLVQGDVIYAAIKTKWREMSQGPWKGIEVNTCVALQGDLQHNTSCSIYEKRPIVCRSVINPGDKQCRNQIKLCKKYLHMLEEKVPAQARHLTVQGGEWW